MNQQKPEQELYYELSYYTHAHPDPSFIHQYIVDVYTVQQADEQTKPIAITFALAALQTARKQGENARRRCFKRRTRP